MLSWYRDGFMGVDRVYDPDSGTVYEVPAGWYEAYDANRGGYTMTELQLLPGDLAYFDLWMRAPQSGSAIH